MDRKISWNKPTGDAWKRTYTSKCGRYTIVKRRYAGARNGTWTVVGYVVTVAGKDLETCDKLVDAKDVAEMHNDPNWEPS